MSKEIIYLFITIGILIVTLGEFGCVAPKPDTDIQPEVVAERPTNNSMLHTQGTQIVDGNNNPIKLRGVLLEGWLMWNGSLWGAGLTSETKIANRLEKMSGKAHVERFRSSIYENFITERDIELISEIGFNVVRVPFNHTIFEDGNPLENYSAIGWKYIDYLLGWCEKHMVYVVLDFHSLPGGQGSFVSDPELINVWHSKEYQQETVDIWKAIANRYKDRQIIAGYDLINEPDAPTGKSLVDLNKRIIESIREVDKHHMVILEGAKFASDFTMFDTPLDANQVYSFHSYNFISDKSDQENLEKLTQIAKAHNVPLWNGEFGAHKLEWVKEEVRLYEDSKYPINGWIFWPWKRVYAEGDRFRALGEFVATNEWEKVATGIASIFAPGKEISPEFAKKAMDDFIESSRSENLVFDKDIMAMLKEALPE